VEVLVKNVVWEFFVRRVESGESGETEIRREENRRDDTTEVNRTVNEQSRRERKVKF
jgi:hypothetical protein